MKAYEFNQLNTDNKKNSRELSKEQKKVLESLMYKNVVVRLKSEKKPGQKDCSFSVWGIERPTPESTIKEIKKRMHLNRLKRDDFWWCMIIIFLSYPINILYLLIILTCHLPWTKDNLRNRTGNASIRLNYSSRSPINTTESSVPRTLIMYLTAAEHSWTETCLSYGLNIRGPIKCGR